MTITAFRLARVWFYLCSLATLTAYAQTSGGAAQTELNITLGEQVVRFAPTRSFQEMRLEVVNSTGEIIFAQLTAEAEFNWNLRQGNGEALAPGLYRYVLALKFSEEVTRHHRGHFIIEAGQDRLWLTAQDGTEVSGAVLNTTYSGGRTIAGVRRGEDGSANRSVTDRTLASESPKQTGGEVKEAAKAAPQTLIPDNLEVAGDISFTDGFADIKTANNTGGLRFYGAPMLDFIPQAAAIQFWGNASGLPGQLFLDTGAHNNAALIFRSTTTGQQILERMRVTANGNVGIGTTSPDVRLEVVGTSGGSLYTTTFGSDNAVIGRSAGGTANAPTATPSGRSLMLLGGRGHNGTSFTLNRATINLEASEAFTNTAAGTRIIFSTTGNGGIAISERMRIDHNGNVGIGTTTPGSRLEVAGAISADFQYNLNGNRILHNTGTTNLFVGVNAGLGITTGFSNAFFGYDAGRLTSTGDRNSFFGRSAGENNFSGNQNSFFGHSAGLTNVTGNDNAFFGYLAGTANMGGHSNSFFGRSAGAANTEGTFNTFVGLFAGQSNVVNGGNTFVGSSAGFNSTGAFNSFFGTNAGSSNTGGDRNTVIGSSANVASGNLSYATALGAGAVVSNSNSVVLGRSTDTVRVPGELNVSGDADFVWVNGVVADFESVYVRGLSEGGFGSHVCHGEGGALTNCISSQRMKEQIQSLPKGLPWLQRLRPVTFNWKANHQPDIGLIAEEVADVEPRLANINPKTGEVVGVKYDQITAVLINAVKEQQAQIAAQQQQITNLKKLVSRTQRRVAALQSAQRKKR